MTILEFLDYLAIAVFAATGALAASCKQIDLVGFVFLAAVTGIGGGTFRDLILARNLRLGGDGRGSSLYRRRHARPQPARLLPHRHARRLHHPRRRAEMGLDLSSLQGAPGPAS
jgi:hypothetical protein